MHYLRHMAEVDTHAVRSSRWVSMIDTRRCAACLRPFPPGAHHRKRFCDARCRRRTESRRRRGLPEADTPTAATGLDLPAQLRARDRQLAGKERVITRLRAARHADRSQLREAQSESAAETRRAERAIAAAATEQLNLRQRNAELQEQLTSMHRQVAAAAGAGEEIARLRQTVSELSAVTELPREVRRQWEALAVRIARQAAGTSLPVAGLDHEVLTTWQRHRKQAGSPQQAAGQPAAPARKQRPAVRPPARAAARPAARPAASPTTPERTQR